MQELPFNKETISGEDMRNALSAMVSKKLFWGKGAVKSMDISNVMIKFTRYRLDPDLDELPLQVGDLHGEAPHGVGPPPLRGRSARRSEQRHCSSAVGHRGADASAVRGGRGGGGGPAHGVRAAVQRLLRPWQSAVQALQGPVVATSARGATDAGRSAAAMKWCGARTATGRGVCGARGATATGGAVQDVQG